MDRRGVDATQAGVTWGRTVLHEFLKVNRIELIDRCRAKAAQRASPDTSGSAFLHGIPPFLDQLIRTLELEQTSDPAQGHSISGPAGGGEPFSSEIGETAARHGLELSQRAFPVAQVVHAYGDLCQATTDLAFELNVPVEVDEFRTLNRCLDNAIAGAITEFSHQRENASAARAADEMHERLASFAHELRDLLNTATLAISAIRTGEVGISGATGTILDRSITGLRHLVDRSLADARVTTALPERRDLVFLADLVAEASTSAALEGRAHKCCLKVGPVEPTLAVEGDPDQLLSALRNLLTNAMKFTEPGTTVSLNAYSSGSRIIVDVEDRCGGLPATDRESMFLPFTQCGADKSGLGLGLAICRRNVEANGGILTARNKPGTGCIFTIDLPGQAAAARVAASAA